MKKHLFLTLLAITASISAFSQVDIDKSINLSNSNPADAKITGIKQVSAARDAVSAEVVQKGSLVYAAAGGTSAAFTVTLAPAITTYTDGMEVRFKAPANNAAAVTLNVNGVGAKTIKKNVSSNLAANDITSGQLVSVIYDAAADAFQLVSRIEQLSNSTTPGTYNNVTVNAQGLVTGGSNVSYAPASSVSGTTGYVPKFTSASAIGNSVIYDNGGNVGIGLTSAGAPLTVLHEASYSFPNPGSSAKGAINIRTTTSNRQTGITFGNAGQDNAQAGIYVHQDNGAGTHMYLATTSDYGTGPQARVTILNSGNVGIGVTSSGVKLRVAGDEEATGQIRATGWLTGTGTGHGMEIGVASSIGYMLSYDRTAGAYMPARLVGSTIEFRHSDVSSDLFINTSGRVGIGHNTPLTPLHVRGALIGSFQGTSKGTLTLDAPYSAGSFNAIDFLYDNGVNPNARIAVQPNGFGTKMMFGTSNSYSSGVTNTALTIDHNGKIGVNQTSPTSTLHVNGDLATQNGLVRRDFLTWSTTASNTTPIHIKTNVTFSDIMYRFLIEGYNYGAQAPIHNEAVGYAYSATGTILNSQNVNWTSGATITQYKSSDGYVVLRLAVSSTYYMGFSVSGWFVNPTGTGFNVSGTVYHQTANL